MVRAKYGADIARAVRAAAAAELARLELLAIEQCGLEYEPGEAWTRCRLVVGHDQGETPTKHRGPGGVEW